MIPFYSHLTPAILSNQLRIHLDLLMQKYENFRNKLRLKLNEVNLWRMMKINDPFKRQVNDIPFTQHKLNPGRK